MAKVKVNKRRHSKIGGWGATNNLTPAQSLEIYICTHCDLDECMAGRQECLLNQQDIMTIISSMLKRQRMELAKEQHGA